MKASEMEYLDNEGYPTDEFLEYLADYNNFNDWREILELVEETWWMPDWGLTRKKPFTHKLFKTRYFHYYISTGGWSGNESIISALKKNFLFWHYWRESKCGGHYKFRFPAEEPATVSDTLKQNQ